MSVYFVHAPDLGLVKIGFAADPKLRFSKIQSDSPSRLVLLGFEDGDEAIEAQRHQQFAAQRHRGEWFRAEGPLLDHIQSLAPLPVKGPSLNKRVISLGVSKAYASMILSGKLTPPISLAILIFRETGWRHPRIAHVTEEQMRVFEEVDPWTPRQAA